MSDFAARHDLSAASLYNWRRRLAQGGGTNLETASNSGNVGDFTELVVREATGSPAPMEVVTANGFTVRIPGAVDAAELRALLQVLQSC